MTIEERLTDALHEADRFEPSPDLFARVNRSIAEDRAHRRRLTMLFSSLAAAALLMAGYFRLVLSTGPSGVTIAAWESVLLDLAILGGLLIVLGPTIRRFARSYVADVFHLNPETGHHFLVVVDLAYYIFFAGLILVNADAYGPLGSEIPLAEGLSSTASRVAFFLLSMGVLHAINIMALPFVGLIFNSTTRLVLRREAGDSAPVEDQGSRMVDRLARDFVVAVVVVALGFVLTLGIGAVIGSLG
jgi:hypothetical protein